MLDKFLASDSIGPIRAHFQRCGATNLGYKGGPHLFDLESRHGRAAGSVPGYQMNAALLSTLEWSLLGESFTVLHSPGTIPKTAAVK